MIKIVDFFYFEIFREYFKFYTLYSDVVFGVLIKSLDKISAYGEIDISVMKSMMKFYTENTKKSKGVRPSVLVELDPSRKQDFDTILIDITQDMMIMDEC